MPGTDHDLIMQALPFWPHVAPASPVHQTPSKCCKRRKDPEEKHMRQIAVGNDMC